MINKKDIYGRTLKELKEITNTFRFPAYATGQISKWLYQKNAASFSDMSDLPLKSREILEKSFFIGLEHPVNKQDSTDGTIKYLFPVQHGGYIEAVYIPDKNRNTLCISTQVGCKMGCVFCMTGKQGFQGNLTSGEILNQLVSIPETQKITNLVFMGMGEPMDNIVNLMKALEILTSPYGFSMSPSRITVSTIGIIPGIKEFIKKSRCHLAVSLNSPFEEERLSFMPVEKKYPLQSIVEFLKSIPDDRQRRISFEYILFRGKNDTPRHVNGLTRLLNGLKCRINLIRYHELSDVALYPSDEKTILWFKERLNQKGILTTIRASRGKDIMAACGLLSTNTRTSPS